MRLALPLIDTTGEMLGPCDTALELEVQGFWPPALRLRYGVQGHGKGSRDQLPERILRLAAKLFMCGIIRKHVFKPLGHGVRVL